MSMPKTNGYGRAKITDYVEEHGMETRRIMKRPSRDEDVHDVLHALKDFSAAEIARNSGLSAGTVSNWRRGPKYGGTRYPQHMSMRMAVAAVGLEFKLVKRGSNLPPD